ncbi:MAG: M23 family metallopeptidase [Oscillospiraceae bacterium]|nr:M23 family metallopeptidase [Oscillospiraceae bacterium]
MKHIAIWLTALVMACSLCACTSSAKFASSNSAVSSPDLVTPSVPAQAEPESSETESSEEQVSSAGSLPAQQEPPLPPETAGPAPTEELPVFSASSLRVKAGDNLFLFVKNVPESVSVTGESSLGTIPVFYPYEDMQMAIFPVRYSAEPGDYSITVACDGASETFALTVLDGGFEVEEFQVDQSVADSTVNSAKANEEYAAATQPLKESGDAAQYWSGAFSLPIHQETFRVSSSFGYTRIINGVASIHGGVDFPAPQGTPVTAPNRGRVLYAGFLQLTGNTVVIEHGFGLKSWYYHMDELCCSEGDMLGTGDLIGRVGTTGYSTGNHLHFGMSVGGVYINPWQYLDGDYFGQAVA